MAPIGNAPVPKPGSVQALEADLLTMSAKPKAKGKAKAKGKSKKSTGKSECSGDEAVEMVGAKKVLVALKRPASSIPLAAKVDMTDVFAKLRKR